jgi:anti-sigma factor (TIGR02949 family)
VTEDCVRIESFVTPFVDGELADAEREAIAHHLSVCPPCSSRVAAERAVRELIQRRKAVFAAVRAPDGLRSTCARLVSADARATPSRGSSPSVAQGFGQRSSPPGPAATWRARLRPFALAASLVLLVGTAFLYRLSETSAHLLAAELAADHMKCFAMNSVLRTHHAPSIVEGAMLAGFGWEMHLPDNPERADLELVGARPCLYDKGKVAHIMYTHQGRPVSLFMLPNTSRSHELVKALGHEAAIWCVGRRTFVLIAHESRQDVERMASCVQAGLQ